MFKDPNWPVLISVKSWLLSEMRNDSHLLLVTPVPLGCVSSLAVIVTLTKKHFSFSLCLTAKADINDTPCPDALCRACWGNPGRKDRLDSCSPEWGVGREKQTSDTVLIGAVKEM